MEDFLKSIGYKEIEPGIWQDKHSHYSPKPLQAAYDYEMGMFE